MKLTRFDSAFNPPNPGKALLTIHAKSACKLSYGAVLELKLSDKTTLALHQDEDSPSDWYVEFNPKEGTPLTTRLADKKSGSGALAFNASAISKRLMESAGNKGGSYMAIPILTQSPIHLKGMTLYPLLTAAAYKNNGRQPRQMKAA